MSNKAVGAIREALEVALRDNPRQLGKVYSLDPQMNKKASEIVELGGAANSGAVGNLRCAIRAILDGTIPNSPTVSRLCISAVKGLLRDNASFPRGVEEHLNAVVLSLEDRASSETFKEEEAQARRQGSQEIIQLLEKRGGVYVYSLPHYLNYPCKSDPDRFWYKVGFTTGEIESRVLMSHKKTGLPEDPIVRRAYFSKSLSPRQMEQKFHKLLAASGLQTEAEFGGVEWFATTESQLDALAELLEFEITRPREEVE